MAKKKGHKGQKKLQGPKLKAASKAKKAKVAVAFGKGKNKAKNRKGGSKAVATNLKKMSFDNNKKIEVLNADITKVLLAPPKLKFLSSTATAPSTSGSTSSSKKKSRAKDDDLDMVDVGAVADKLASL